MAAWRRKVTVAVVVSLAATGLAVVDDDRPAAAQIPIAEPSDCVVSPDGSRVVCGGISIPTSPTPTPLQPPLQVSGFLERIVRGPAAQAWLPLETEARNAVAELHGVPNDNRLLVTAREEVRSYLFMRLLSLVDQRAAGTEPLTAEEQAALAALQTAADAQRRLGAQKAIDQYDDWATNKCNGWQPPAGFGFQPYATGGGCAPLGVLAGGPPTPAVEQFEAYGAALAWSTFTSSGDAAAAWQKLDLGAAFAYGVFGALAGGLGAGAIAATLSQEASRAIVRAILPFTARALHVFGQAGGRLAIGIASRALSQLALGATAASLAAGLAGVILFAAAVTAIGGVVFTQNATTRQKLVDARNQATVDLAKLAGTTEGQLTLLGVVVDQTLPDLAAERAALITTPTTPPPGDLQWEVTTPGPAAAATQPVLTTVNHIGQLQETFVADGYFVTRAAGGAWTMGLTLDYLGPRIVPGQTGQKRRLGIRNGQLWDHAIELPAPPGQIVVTEAPVLRDSFGFIPSILGVPLNSTDTGPVHTARLVGNQPPTITGGLTFYLTDGQTVLDEPAPGILGLLADPDGGTITVTGVPEPPDGQLTIDGDTGAFQYVRNGAALPDTFVVTVSDSRGGSTNVPIAIAGNRAPVVNTTTTLLSPELPFAYICPVGDPDGDPLVLEVTDDADKANVVPELGCFRYTLDLGAIGDDAFSFRADDGRGGVVTGTANVTIVVPSNLSFLRPPPSVPEDTVVTFRLNKVPTLPTTFSCGNGAIVGIPTDRLQCVFPDPNPAETVSFTDISPAGVPATQSFTVAVTDATPPAWATFPGNIEVAATTPAGAAVTYPSPTVSDGTVACAPASGATFAVGVTQVECTATDTSGNTTDRRAFSVKVNPFVALPGPVAGVPAFVPVFSTSGLRTSPRSLNGATVRGPIAVWPNVPASGPAAVSVTYQLLGPLGRGFSISTTTRTAAPFDLAGVNAATGQANLRTLSPGVWALITSVRRSGGATVNRVAAFLVR